MTRRPSGQLSEAEILAQMLDDEFDVGEDAAADAAVDTESTDTTAQSSGAQIPDADTEAGATGAADGPELRSLAQLAASLQRLKPVEPAPRKLRPGRAAFIAAGVRRAEDSGTRNGLWMWLAGHLRLATTATAMALALVVGLASVAAADSLPGDPLYSVKRAEEQIRWQLADGPERARLADTFEHRRAEEAQALTQMGREEQVDFTCTVAEVLSGADTAGMRIRCQEGGVVVELNRRLNVVTGAVLDITGKTAEGRVLATSANVTAMPAVARAPPVADPTPESPTRTPPPATDVPEGTPETPAADTEVLATQAATSTFTPVPPTQAPPPTAEPTRPAVVEWSGRLESVGPEVWVVAGQAFRRGTGRIDEAVGPAKPGAMVHVRAERRDGDLWLIELTVTAPAAEPQSFELAGTIDAVEDGALVVDGQRFAITENTQVNGELVVGHLARVRGLRHPDGRMEAVEITVEEPDPPEAQEWSGIIEQIDEEFWVIDRKRVFIDSETEIAGEPRLGARVDVRARRRDGAWWALRLEVRSMTGIDVGDLRRTPPYP